jgi:hypothetical protein
MEKKIYQLNSLTAYCQSRKKNRTVLQKLYTKNCLTPLTFIVRKSFVGDRKLVEHGKYCQGNLCTIV